jgi:hypothetical protein
MSELPVIVGAARGRLPGDRGDQLVYDNDGGLVIHASTVIDGVAISQHRPCLLVVNGARFKVCSYAAQDRRHVYQCRPWNPGPYDREGVVVEYDPDRLHNERVHRLHFAARGALLLVLMPIVPFLGLLPENAKKTLKLHGLLPAGSQMGSLMLEWVLLLAVVALELVLVVAGSGFAIVCALFALTLIVDIAHRIVLVAENRDVGMLAWPRELWRAIRETAPTPTITQGPRVDPPDVTP